MEQKAALSIAHVCGTGPALELHPPARRTRKLGTLRLSSETPTRSCSELCYRTSEMTSLGESEIPRTCMSRRVITGPLFLQDCERDQGRYRRTSRVQICKYCVIRRQPHLQRCPSEDCLKRFVTTVKVHGSVESFMTCDRVCRQGTPVKQVYKLLFTACTVFQVRTVIVANSV